MRRYPATALEGGLWTAYRMFDSARQSGCGVSDADEALRVLVAGYLAAGPEHVSALRTFLQALDAELAHLERERAVVAAEIELADADRRRLRAHVLNAMRAAGTTSVPALRGCITVGRARKSIEVRDVARVPERFVAVTPEVKRVREREVLAALDAGEVVPGVVVVTDQQTLVVR